ncbi:MAG: PTS glucitol/sorbitol transporter subunit IIA [Aestuariivirga sp.]
MFLKTTIKAVGPDVADLVENGVLILFAEGAPPELAEVSVLHKVEATSDKAPKPGDKIMIGKLAATITAIGPAAWKKVLDIGHVVINFNDAKSAERPGEICATMLAAADIMANLNAGNIISIS